MKRQELGCSARLTLVGEVRVRRLRVQDRPGAGEHERLVRLRPGAIQAQLNSTADGRDRGQLVAPQILIRHEVACQDWSTVSAPTVGVDMSH